MNFKLNLLGAYRVILSNSPRLTGYFNKVKENGDRKKIMKVFRKMGQKSINKDIILTLYFVTIIKSISISIFI